MDSNKVSEGTRRSKGGGTGPLRVGKIVKDWEFLRMDESEALPGGKGEMGAWRIGESGRQAWKYE